MARKVKIVRQSDGEQLPEGTTVFRYDYAGVEMRVDANGEVEIPDDGWTALNVHLRGGSPLGDRLMSPCIGPGDGSQVILALDHNRDSLRIGEATTVPGGSLKPPPASPPPMGFERTSPPTNNTGGSLITRNGINTFFGVAPLLNALSDRRITDEQLRIIVRVIYTIGGNLLRQLRNLGVKHHHEHFVHSVVNAAEHRRRLRVVLEECRRLGVYLEYSFTDQPDRNRPAERGEGYDTWRDNTLDGNDRLTVSLMRTMVDRELGHYKVGGSEAEVGKALVIEIANEPWEFVDMGTHGRIYDELGKRDFRNRFVGNVESAYAFHFGDGSPLFVHMDSAMPRGTAEIFQRIEDLQVRNKQKPVVLDFDGARMWDRTPESEDRFKGMSNFLEVVQECARRGIGVVVHLTEPYTVHEPFVKRTLPAPFAGKREWATIDALQVAAEAYGL